MMYLKWLSLFPLNLAIELVAYVFNPFVALIPTTHKITKGFVRIQGKEVEMFREYLIKPVYWFQTHDNPVDEWWYGGYYKSSFFPFVRKWTQDDYDNSWWKRYLCRVMWMMRNNAYGFSYNLFGAPREDGKNAENGFLKRKYSWQYKKDVRLWGDYYTSINIGWKGHANTDRLMYASRIFGGIRK